MDRRKANQKISTQLIRTGVLTGLTLLMLLVFSGCMTYYQRQAEFQQSFRQGRIEDAARVLGKERRADRRRNRLLFLMNQGVVHQMMGEYAQSNRFFEEAFLLSEDMRRNLGEEALALLTNPNVTAYRGEDFELLMIHYYKAMNFLHLGNFEAALVECRRLNIRLAQLEDRHRSNNRYRRDAFIHNLMGIIYDASGDFNNAFIAYRNAFEIYSEDYASLFGLEAPEQLKHDLIRAAHRTGFRDLAAQYEKQFGIRHVPDRDPNLGELVFFWQNGLGPVKEEWSLNFTIVRGAGGVLSFRNEEMGLDFPYFGDSQEATGGLGDLRVIRAAFPAFAERRPVYATARLRFGDQSVNLQKAQDINAIAFRSLEDRMLREMGQALLRLAIRQAAEQAVRKEDQTLGAILGLLGAVAEQADTRNWQTLPHSIHYARISLPAGTHTLSLETHPAVEPISRVSSVQRREIRQIPIEVQIRRGQTRFHQMHTLDSR